jgi:hypothetical protein
MPVINLTWTNGTYNPTDNVYGANAWINELKWKLNGAGGAQIPQSAGLYVILNPVGTVVYAGKAGSFRDRFKSRSESLENLDARTAAIPNVQVNICSVNAAAEIDLAERWLVRILFIRDGGLAARHLQNVLLTGQFYAPAGGLTINNVGTCPAYLNANYVYAANAAI